MGIEPCAFCGLRLTGPDVCGGQDHLFCNLQCRQAFEDCGRPELPFRPIPWKDATDPKGIDTGQEYLVRWPDGKVRQGEWYPFWRLWIDQMGDSFDQQPRWYVAMGDLPGPGEGKA